MCKLRPCKRVQSYPLVHWIYQLTLTELGCAQKEQSLFTFVSEVRFHCNCVWWWPIATDCRDHRAAVQQWSSCFEFHGSIFFLINRPVRCHLSKQKEMWAISAWFTILMSFFFLLCQISGNPLTRSLWGRRCLSNRKFFSSAVHLKAFLLQRCVILTSSAPVACNKATLQHSADEAYIKLETGFC